MEARGHSPFWGQPSVMLLGLQAYSVLRRERRWKNSLFWDWDFMKNWECLSRFCLSWVSQWVCWDIGIQRSTFGYFDTVFTPHWESCVPEWEHSYTVTQHLAPHLPCRPMSAKSWGLQLAHLCPQPWDTRTGQVGMVWPRLPLIMVQGTVSPMKLIVMVVVVGRC